VREFIQHNLIIMLTAAAKINTERARESTQLGIALSLTLSLLQLGGPPLADGVVCMVIDGDDASASQSKRLE
jgi:hypothetical protein